MLSVPFPSAEPCQQPLVMADLQSQNLCISDIPWDQGLEIGNKDKGKEKTKKKRHVGWNNFKYQYRLQPGWLGITPAEKDLGCPWPKSWTWVCPPASQWQMPTAQQAASATTRLTVWASSSPPLFCTCEEYISGVLCSVLGFPVQESYQQAKASSSKTHWDG